MIDILGENSIFSTFKLRSVYYQLFVLFILFTGCTKNNSLGYIIIEEKDGLDRELEYIRCNILLNKKLSNSQQLTLIEINSGKSIATQILNWTKINNDLFAEVIFPITIKPLEKETFEMFIERNNKVEAPSDKIFYFENKDEWTFVQNSFYIAELSNIKNYMGGQIKTLILKNNEDIVLKREHLSMHFSPNFARPKMESYSNIENMLPSSQNLIVKGKYCIETKRVGVIDDFQEIQVEAKYEFYRDLPFFIFDSRIIIKKVVELGLLRNDEMTMDSLFTNLMYKQKLNGNINNISLYGDDFDILEQNPITDDAPWLFFYHKEKGYAFGNIRLEYENINMKGTSSTVDLPFTKISKGINGGRYWNRILIQRKNMMVSEGDVYREKNAYIVFKFDSISPEKEINYYEKRLRHPLLFTVNQQNN